MNTVKEIKPNKGTVWFDKFVEENKQEILEYKQELRQQIVKKGKLSFTWKDNQIFDWKILWKPKRKKLPKFKSLKKYD
jgi:hypothetical protein